jgi:hypothetical protein
MNSTFGFSAAEAGTDDTTNKAKNDRANRNTCFSKQKESKRQSTKPLSKSGYDRKLSLLAFIPADCVWTTIRRLPTCP